MQYRDRALLPSAGALLVLSLLAGCSGGGSSGSSLPGPPTTAPSSGPTAGPTSGPTAAPSGGPTPGPTSTPTPPGASSSTIVTAQGSVAGAPGNWSPSIGDTSSGGQGAPVDGITCDPTMSNNYHIHVWLGLWVNGQEVALPMGAGMVNPGPAVSGFINTATCFYHIHTHDQSGIVHVEDPDPQGVPITQSLYTLKDFFDIWGITVNANQFGPYTGPVRVFTSGQIYRGDDASSNFVTPASSLTYYGNDPSTVPAYSHEVIDVEVGPTYPTTPLPNVQFYLEF
jgi:hypothetical protein